MKKIDCGFQIVKPKNPEDHYTIVPNILIKANNLDYFDRIVVEYLLIHKDGFLVNKQFIADGIGCCWKSVFNSLKRLEKIGIISFQENLLFIHLDKIIDRNESHRNESHRNESHRNESHRNDIPIDIGTKVIGNRNESHSDYEFDSYNNRNESHTNNTIQYEIQDEKNKTKKQDYASGSVLGLGLFVGDLDEDGLPPLFSSPSITPNNGLKSKPQQDVLADDHSQDPASRPNAGGGINISQVGSPTDRSELVLRAATDNQTDTPCPLPDKASVTALDLKLCIEKDQDNLKSKYLGEALNIKMLHWFLSLPNEKKSLFGSYYNFEMYMIATLSEEYTTRPDLIEFLKAENSAGDITINQDILYKVKMNEKFPITLKKYEL